MMPRQPMHWYIGAPFITQPSDLWLAAMLQEPQQRFTSVVADYRHDRSRKRTSAANWLDYARHGHAIWRTASSSRRPFGIVTSFPQLPMIIGLEKRLAASRAPLVAWTFNVGTLYTGAKGWVAKRALSSVDLFVVHSTSEIAACSAWLDLPPERFAFVPLQRYIPEIVAAETMDKPFVLSMGSAHRDYRLFFEVMRELGYPTIVVAGPHAVEGLTLPPNVEVRSGLSTEQCNLLLQQERLSVIPIANRTTASGQVTLIDAMMYARPAIVTECPASVDYVRHGEDAWLVRHGDHDDMKRAIELLWNDDARRAAMAHQARVSAIERFSDDVIARRLDAVLSSFETSR